MGNCRIYERFKSGKIMILELIPKLLKYKLSYYLKPYNPLPMNYTISLCYRCNSRCKTCNIYKKKVNELSLEEYNKIFKNIGKSPFWITFSGGEPFLRNDIYDIAFQLINICKPKILNIPTNGIKTNFIIDTVKKMAEISPKTHFVINISLDSYGQEHDEIRQVPGNYKKAIATFNELKSLGIKNLSVGIHTVISKFNVANFQNIYQKLNELQPDSYITEIAENRIELDTMNEKITPTLLEYKKAIDYLMHNMKYSSSKKVGLLTKAVRLEYYKIVKKVLIEKKQIIPCFAGTASVQIAPDGNVWNCCIRAKSIGNLRDCEYNFKKIWSSNLASKDRKYIKAKKCYCPLANVSYTNILFDYISLLKILKNIVKLVI